VGLSGFLLLASKVFFDYQFAMASYRTTVMTTLFDKSLDSNHGAILYIFENLKTQEVKEVILGYAELLFQDKSGLTEEELDGRCEDFLLSLLEKKKLDKIEIDFEVDDSLGKLKDLKLLNTSGRNYSVVPLQQANKLLEEYWKSIPTKKKK